MKIFLALLASASIVVAATGSGGGITGSGGGSVSGGGAGNYLNTTAADQIFVDGIVGDDNASYPGPYLSLAKAQSVSTNGVNTIVVLKGTFFEGNIASTNCNSWYFARGVVLTNTAIIFSANTLNNFYILGDGTFFYTLAGNFGPIQMNKSNSVLRCDFDTGYSYNTLKFINAVGTSNEVFVTCNRMSGNIQAHLTNYCRATIVGNYLTNTYTSSGGPGAGVVSNNICYIYPKILLVCSNVTSVNQETGIRHIYGGNFKHTATSAYPDAIKVRWYLHGTHVDYMSELPGGGAYTNVYGNYTTNAP